MRRYNKNMCMLVTQAKVTDTQVWEGSLGNNTLKGQYYKCKGKNHLQVSIHENLINKHTLSGL